MVKTKTFRPKKNEKGAYQIMKSLFQSKGSLKVKALEKFNRKQLIDVIIYQKANYSKLKNCYVETILENRNMERQTKLHQKKYINIEKQITRYHNRHNNEQGGK